MLFTFDRALASRAWTFEDCAGVVCWTGSSKAIGGMIRYLARLASDKAAEAMIGMVEYANK